MCSDSDQQIEYGKTNPESREWWLGFPQKREHKEERESPADQSQRHWKVLLPYDEEIVAHISKSIGLDAGVIEVPWRSPQRERNQRRVEIEAGLTDVLFNAQAPHGGRRCVGGKCRRWPVHRQRPSEPGCQQRDRCR